MAGAKISVIVPIYNAEKYMDKCIASVLNQTHKNLELLLINDGSADNSQARCLEYADKDSRVRVINQDNAGPAKARNRGINEATGEFLFFVDSDDWVEQNAIEKMLEVIDDKIDIVQCRSRKMYDDGHEDTDIWKESTLRMNSYDAMKDYLWSDYPIIRFAVWGKLIRKSITEGLTFPDIKHGEDVVFNAYLIDKAAEIIYIPDILYNFAVRENSISHTMILEERIKDSLIRDENITKLIFSKKVYKPFYNRVYWGRIMNIFNRSCQAYKYDRKDWKSKVRDLYKYFRQIETLNIGLSVKQRIIVTFYRIAPNVYVRIMSRFI